MKMWIIKRKFDGSYFASRPFGCSNFTKNKNKVRLFATREEADDLAEKDMGEVVKIVKALWSEK